MNAIPKRKWRRSEILLLVVPSLLLPLAWLWSATRPAPVPIPPPPLYRVSDLGTLSSGGGFSGFVTGINDHGDVVGDWAIGKTIRPFVLRKGKVKFIGSVASKGGTTTAADINNAGEVVGTMENSNATARRAFSWRNGKLALLPLLGGKDSGASAINERGQIVGYAETRFPDAAGYDTSHAVMWEKGHIRDLKVPAKNQSDALGINNKGEVVCMAVNTGLPILNGADTATNKCFLWRNGNLADVGEAGVHTVPRGVNDSGTIVADVSNNIFLWRDGSRQNIQTPPGTDVCFTSAINNAGQCVGSIRAKGRVFAFVYRNGQLYDLNALTPGSGWNLYRANDINERGQIVGMGKFKGQRRSFLLTPITR